MLFLVLNFYFLTLDEPSVDLRNKGSGHATPCLGAAFLKVIFIILFITKKISCAPKLFLMCNVCVECTVDRVVQAEIPHGTIHNTHTNSVARVGFAPTILSTVGNGEYTA